MRKSIKTLKAAAQAEQNTPAAAAIMTVAPINQDAAQPTDQAAAPVDEAEQPSPLSVATDQPTHQEPAPAAEKPAALFTPLLAPQAPRPMDELLEIVSKAKSTTDRLNGLKTTSEKLSGFSVGREGFTDRLTLRDGDGNEWNTTQSVIIQEVLSLVRDRLRTAIGGTEAELRQLLQAAA
ncbi:MAG: hypothetical protein ACRYFX_04565 [Janthinobacterium lividum]